MRLRKLQLIVTVVVLQGMLQPLLKFSRMEMNFYGLLLVLVPRS